MSWHIIPVRVWVDWPEGLEGDELADRITNALEECANSTPGVASGSAMVISHEDGSDWTVPVSARRAQAA